MSKNPPEELRDLIVKKHRSRMISDFRKGIRNIPRHSVAEGLVEFTERKRILVSGTSAIPGPYKYFRAPYLREPAECLSEYSRTVELVMMKGTQTGGTDGIMMNHELYCIEYGIGPVQYVSSDDDLALEHMEKRVGPMIEAAGMQGLITPPVQKRSNKGTGDTKRSKSYKGTFLRAVGSRSESKLSSLPSRILHIDEIDKYLSVLSGGGNPVEKAIRRTDSYRNLKKIVYISTPKNKETSQIEPLFNQGDMRYYYFQCPSCREYQKIIWSQIKWDKDDNGDLYIEYDEDGNATNDPVYMVCKNPECDHKIRDHEKSSFLKEKGHGGTAEWRASKKPDRPGMRSYHVNALYGFRSWLDIVLQWCNIDGDDDKLQDFMNDTLGETWEKKIDKPSEHYLAARAEQDWTRGQVNDKVKIITSGWDIHKDRVEGAVMGWNVRKESWAIDYHVFDGTPSDPNDPCWDKMEEVIMKDYYKQNCDKIKMTTAFVDAGYETESVKNFCERFPYSPNSYKGVYPVFGRKRQTEVVKQHTGTIATPEVLMDDQKLKRELYMHLKKKEPATGHNVPNGYIHFPRDYSDVYYAQLVAEDITEITDSKGMQTEIIIHNPSGRRNEALDCTKMALAGLYYIQLTFFKIWNNKRKSMRRKEFNPDWQLFWKKQGIDPDEESVMEDTEDAS